MEDYIVLQDYDGYWHEIFFFDHYLTNGDIKTLEKTVQKVKDDLPGEYTNEDIENAIAEVMPYTKTITLSETDYYRIIYF